MTKTAGERLRTEGSNSSSTMWSKSREKKAMAKYYTRNFGTGYVEADEYHLNRVGLRGRKRWLLLSAVLLGYVIVLGHLALTCLLLGVLRFEASGPPYFEFRDDGVLRWPEGAVISDVRLGSSLEAFNNQSMAIYGDDNKQVILTSGSQRFSAIGNSLVNSSQASFSESEIKFSPFNLFSVEQNGVRALSVNSSLVNVNTFSGIQQLTSSNGITTSSVRAPLDSQLTIGSDSGLVSLLGTNGVFLTGGNINISSSHNLNLRANSGSIVVEGENGVYLRGLPTTGSSSAYHICACTGNGRLFLVPSNSDRCALAAANNAVNNICS